MGMSKSLLRTAKDGRIIVNGETGNNVLGFYNDSLSQVKYN
jgi:hypothetical protein